MFKKLKQLAKIGEWKEVEKIVTKLKPETRNNVLSQLSKKVLIKFLPQLPENIQAEFISSIKLELATEILSKLTSDKVVNILQTLKPTLRRRIIESFSEEKAKETTPLLKYYPETAGDIMTTQFVALDENMLVKKAINEVRKKSKRHRVYYIYVTDLERKLVGVLSLRRLILANPRTKLRNIMRKNIMKVLPDTDQEVVANLIKEHNLLALPVVDNENRILGIVTADDAMKVMEKEATEDIVLLSGASPLEHVLTSRISDLVKVRFPALLVGVIGSFLMSLIVSRFETFIQLFVPLAFFLPFIVYMADACGTQAEGTTIRTLALHYRGFPVKKYILKKFVSGIVLGAIFGFIAFCVSTIIWKFKIGLVVGLATFFAMSFSNLLSSSLPILYKKLGFDPAAISGPLNTILSDISSIIFYFLIAILILPVL